MNIGYKLFKNMMPATAEKAPYLGMAIPVGSLAYDNILREMIKAGTKMTQPTAKYFLDALYEYAAEAIAAEVVRINIGSVSLQPMIDGSFDSEDANFDPKRNSLYVGASFSQELRDRVAGIAPDFAGDTSVGTVKLHSCMDLETQVFKVIRGTGSFRLAGANLAVPDGEDESLALYAKDGVTKVTDIVVSETDGGQRITCHLSNDKAVPNGTYKVRLASHGLDPTDPLTVATLTVTLVEAVPAPPEPIAESSDGVVKVYAVADDAGASTPEGLLSAHGTLFVKGTGVTLQTGPTAPGIESDVECDLDASHGMRPGISVEQTADGISVEFGSESGMMKNGEYPDAKLVLRYHKTGEEGSPELIEIPVGIKVTEGQEDWPD